MFQNEPPTVRDRKGERGAALVMTLLICFLLLVASAGLLLESSMNTANVTDSISEQQAYNAAESGIQSVVDVLRYKCTEAVSTAGGCRVKPNPLYNTALAEFHKDNHITYSKVLTLDTSNNAADASTAPRLSRILGYTGTGENDPVKLVDPDAPYNRFTDYAFNVQVSDPDNTGTRISFLTRGELHRHQGDKTQVTFPLANPTAADRTVVKYHPTVKDHDIPAGTVSPTDFGHFTVTVFGNGAPITELVRFEIVVEMTVPFPAERTMRGFIQPDSTAPYVPAIIFDSKTYDIRGSSMVLEFGGLTGYPAWTATPTPAMRMTGLQPYGYEAGMVEGQNVISGTLSSPEPTRLLVKSTGYGPRGAVKQLEAIIQKNYFNGLGAPATVTLVGPSSTTNPSTDFLFDPGASNAMLYSGVNVAAGSSDIIPPVGVTTSPNPLTGDDPNLDEVIAGFGSKINNTVQGVPSNVASEIPFWLRTPQNLDATVKMLYDTALNSYDPTNSAGRVFTGTNPTSWGDNAAGTGITFCDGNCTLGPIAGGGILVVTGQLTLHGNFDWKGLIIVTGKDGVIRTGGGTGEIQGNIVVAPYRNSLVSDNAEPPAGMDFLAPQWDTQGGGNSEIRFNSDSQNGGLGAVSNVVLGVVEK